MIKEKMQLSFLESDAKHLPISNYYHHQRDITIYKLALVLEAKYEVLKTFCDMYHNKMIEIITKELIYCSLKNTSEDDSKRIIANAIRNLYLDYMENEEHGVVSRRSIITGTVGLIDTGQYYSNMNIAFDKITAIGEFE